jgi:hypothetical protein
MQPAKKDYIRSEKFFELYFYHIANHLRGVSKELLKFLLLLKAKTLNDFKDIIHEKSKKMYTRV